MRLITVLLALLALTPIAQAEGTTVTTQGGVVIILPAPLPCGC